MTRKQQLTGAGSHVSAHQSGKQKMEKVHDRRSTDLTLGSIVAVVDVPDPYEPDKLITVLRSTRDDPLAGLLARRFIDNAQYEAGRRWQRLHEQSTIGVMKAIDPMKEAVDGGKLADLLGNAQIAAFAELRAAYNAITNKTLVYEILAERLTIQQAAARRGMFTRWKVRRVGKMFRRELENLAVHWGATGSTKRGRRYA